MKKYPDDEDQFLRAYRNEWLRVRRKALKRDNYTCFLCGITKEKLLETPTGNRTKDHLNVHHLEPPSQELDKLITLCWDCHKKMEGKISIKDEQGKTTGYTYDKQLQDETRSIIETKLGIKEAPKLG